MSAVGDTLRRERVRQGLALEQISRETKISARLLDAIEKERFDQLPGGVFAKSFVRQYARFLGLEDSELAAEVDRLVNPEPERPEASAVPPEPAFKVPPVAEWEGATVRSRSSMLPALAMVVAVMLVCSAVYAWWQRSRIPGPPVHAASQHTAPTEVMPAAANKPLTPPASEPAQSAPAQSAPATDPVSSAALHVSMTADEDAWIQAWADGKTVTVGILAPNIVKTVDANDDIRIRTGNAGSLQVTVNGKPAGPLGPKGQVRTLEVNRTGMQILAPQPKPAPAAPEPL